MLDRLIGFGLVCAVVSMQGPGVSDPRISVPSFTAMSFVGFAPVSRAC
jgi:hypothetical protein